MLNIHEVRAISGEIFTDPIVPWLCFLQICSHYPNKLGMGPLGYGLSSENTTLHFYTVWTGNNAFLAKARLYIKLTDVISQPTGGPVVSDELE